MKAVAILMLSCLASTLVSPLIAQERERIVPDAKSALIVVDVQNCFVDGGSLPVEDGRAVVPVINRLAPAFDNIVVTQDWHTRGHASFASSHPGRKPFETTAMPYGTQVLWPDHCVQGTHDAALVDGLDLPTAQLVIRKGFHRDVDSYSAFEEADHRTTTGLAAYLKARGIGTVYVVGLATDFCVAWTAMDARKAGFRTFVIEDATRAIDLDGSLVAAMAAMKKGRRDDRAIGRLPATLTDGLVARGWQSVSLTVNGRVETRVLPREATLLHLLRNDLALNGPKYGCGLGQCGACTVLVDGTAARACVIPAHGVDGRNVVTLEGLGTIDRPHPVQQAFIDAQAAQCGYCLNGMIMATVALLSHTPRPTRAQVGRALSHNLCRCGAHVEIVKAVLSVHPGE